MFTQQIPESPCAARLVCCAAFALLGCATTSSPRSSESTQTLSDNNYAPSARGSGSVQTLEDDDSPDALRNAEGNPVLANANCPLGFVIRNAERTRDIARITTSFSAPYGNLTPHYSELRAGVGETFLILEVDILNVTNSPQKFEGSKLRASPTKGNDQVSLVFGARTNAAVKAAGGNPVEFFFDSSKSRDRSEYTPLSATSRDLGVRASVRYTLLAAVSDARQMLVFQYDDWVIGKITLAGAR